MDTIKCNNCGHDNKSTNDRCEVCGEELRPVGNFLNVDYSQDKSKEINLDGKKTNFGLFIFSVSNTYVQYVKYFTQGCKGEGCN